MEQQSGVELYEPIRLRGAFMIALCDLEGTVLKREVLNTVVLTGRAWVLKQLQSVNHVTQQNIGFIAIGSGAVAPTTADTALGNEVTRLAISSFDTTNLTANPPSWQAQVSFATSDANTTLSEVNLINSSATGTMLCRATFASFVKATSNTLQISYTISA